MSLPTEYAKSIISIAWACSSLTKAYLLLYNTGGAPFIFRKRLAEDEKRIVACWHMLIVYTLLRWLKFKSLPSPHVSSVPSLVALASRLFWCYLPTLFIEEFIHFFLLRHFMHIHNSMCLTLKGRPVLEGAKDNDCCICYGVGVGIGNGLYYGQDDSSEETLGVIENYCKVSHHVAHRNCMLKWYTTGITDGISHLTWQNLNLRLTQERLIRSVPTCPICRGKIIFEVIQKNLLEKVEANEEEIWKDKNNWLLKLEALIKDWRNVMNCRWIIVRVGVTAVYILMVWRVLKWREKIIRTLTYYN